MLLKKKELQCLFLHISETEQLVYNNCYVDLIVKHN